MFDTQTINQLQQQLDVLEHEAHCVLATAKTARALLNGTAPKKRANQRGPVLVAARAIIKARGLNYVTVANCIGYKKKTLENVLGGLSISRPLLERLAKFLGVSVNELFHSGVHPTNHGAGTATNVVQGIK